jgi:hypothetical protein
MSGFTVEPDGLQAHAAQVAAVGDDVGSGAAAEVAGAGQADFGLLIGDTIGFGIRAVAEHAEQALQASAQALSAAAGRLRATADDYRGTETANTAGVTSSGGAW